MKRLLIVFSVFLTLIILVNTYWWIKCAVTFDGFENILNEYLSVFPQAIANGRTIAYLSLLVISLNIVILIYLLNRRAYTGFSIILISVNGLVFVWTLFTLM